MSPCFMALSPVMPSTTISDVSTEMPPLTMTARHLYLELSDSDALRKAFEKASTTSSTTAGAQAVMVSRLEDIDIQIDRSRFTGPAGVQRAALFAAIPVIIFAGLQFRNRDNEALPSTTESDKVGSPKEPLVPKASGSGTGPTDITRAAAAPPSVEATQTERILKKLYDDVEGKIRKDGGYSPPPLPHMPARNNKKDVVMGLEATGMPSPTKPEQAAPTSTVTTDQREHVDDIAMKAKQPPEGEGASKHKKAGDEEAILQAKKLQEIQHQPEGEKRKAETQKKEEEQKAALVRKQQEDDQQQQRLKLEALKKAELERVEALKRRRENEEREAQERALEAKRKAEEQAAVLKRRQEEEQEKKRALEAKRKAEEQEAALRKQQEEARRKAEEESRLKRQQEEAAARARAKAEEEAAAALKKAKKTHEEEEKRKAPEANKAMAETKAAKQQEEERRRAIEADEYKADSLRLQEQAKQLLEDMTANGNKQKKGGGSTASTSLKRRAPKRAVSAGSPAPEAEFIKRKGPSPTNPVPGKTENPVPLPRSASSTKRDPEEVKRGFDEVIEDIRKQVALKVGADDWKRTPSKPSSRASASPSPQSSSSPLSSLSEKDAVASAESLTIPRLKQLLVSQGVAPLSSRAKKADYVAAVVAATKARLGDWNKVVAAIKKEGGK